LDHSPPIPFKCSNSVSNITVPGDFSSDAKFFVFTGVVSFLGALGSLLIYVFFSPLYADESKKPPLVDFWFTLVVSVFGLAPVQPGRMDSFLSSGLPPVIGSLPRMGIPASCPLRTRSFLWMYAHVTSLTLDISSELTLRR
ncbi:Synaptophysin-like protein 2, partial [Caligus rogercresseyi]